MLVHPQPVRNLSAFQRVTTSYREWIDLNPVHAFALLSFVYLIVVIVLSNSKLLWLDEQFTLHIARSGSLTSIWQALSHAADPNPPLTHLAVLASLRLFGDHDLALRLPAIIGYWIGMLALFLFLCRRLPPTWALAGTVLSMACGAFAYSYESRSYGMLYGFTMLAILAWSVAVDPNATRKRRRISVFTMILALAAGISTNYFAVLAIALIACAQLVRSIYPKPNFDWTIWIALTLSATPLLLFRSLIQVSIATFAPHAWNKVSYIQVINSYILMVGIVFLPVILILLLPPLLFLLRNNSPNGIEPRWIAELVRWRQLHTQLRIFPPHEIVAVLLLMLYPVLGYCLASFRGGMLSPRFVLAVALGFGIGGVIVSYRLFAHLPGAAMTALAISFVLLVYRVACDETAYFKQNRAFHLVIQDLGQLPPDKPIVVSDQCMILPLDRYARRSIASRLVFPIDLPEISRLRGDDSAEENLLGARYLYPIQIVSLAELQSTSASYFLLANSRIKTVPKSRNNWLVQHLTEQGYQLEQLPFAFTLDTAMAMTPLSISAPVIYLYTRDRRRP